MPRKIHRIGLRHYGAKTVELNDSVDWESVVTEIFIGFLLGVFAYMGYVGGILLLFVPCFIGSVICFYAVLRSAVLYFCKKSKKKRVDGPKS
ncbi:hypothetical protein GCM10027180_19350 [Microbulbifer echini]